MSCSRTKSRYRYVRCLGVKLSSVGVNKWRCYQVEDTKLVSASEDGQTELEVEIVVPPRPQQDVRPIGSDIDMGAVLADKGTYLFCKK